MKNSSAHAKDSLYLTEFDYEHTPYPEQTEKAVRLFNDIGLRPTAYQLGHRFFNIDNSKIFETFTVRTLEEAVLNLGLQTFWVPTIDELLYLVGLDGILVSLYPRIINGQLTYRTAIHDPMTTLPPHKQKLPESDEEKYETTTFISTDIWVSLAIPIASHYSRRRQQHGKKFTVRTIHIPKNKYRKLLRNIDQEGGIVTYT